MNKVGVESTASTAAVIVANTSILVPYSADS